MKKTSKVMSVVLALMLIANILAFSASAADYKLKVSLSTSVANVEAGKTFDLYLVLKSSAASPKWASGEFPVAYDSAYLETPTLTNVSTAGYAWEPTIDLDHSAVSHTQFEAAVSAKELSDYGWDTIRCFILPNKTGFSYVDLTAGATVYKVTFTVKAGVANGTKIYLGIPADCISDKGELYFNEGLSGVELYGNYDGDMNPANNYDISNALTYVTVGSAVPSVANGPTQVQWANKSAGLMNIAFRGVISGYTPTFVPGSTTEIADIMEAGVLFSKSDDTPTLAEVGSTCSKVPAYTLYKGTAGDTGTGTYFFRAIATNASFNDSIESVKTVYAVAYIEMSDGTTYYYSADVLSTTAAAQYTRATGHGMPAFA